MVCSRGHCAAADTVQPQTLRSRTVLSNCDRTAPKSTPADSVTPPSPAWWLTSDLCVDFQNVPLRIREVDSPVTSWLVGRRIEDCDSFLQK